MLERCYAEGVNQFQPRVKPWESDSMLFYPEGVVQDFARGSIVSPFQGDESFLSTLPQGFTLGWNWLTPLASERIKQLDFDGFNFSTYHRTSCNTQ
jgi:hypothetical protein